VPRNVLHILQNAPPSFTRMDGPCVQWRSSKGTLYVTLSSPFALSYQNTKRNLKILRNAPFWPSMFSHRSRSASRRVLTSSCKYTLFSLSKRGLKDQTGKKLASMLLTQSGTSWQIAPTSLTLRVPTCPLLPFYVLGCIILKHKWSIQFSLAPMLAKWGTSRG
jgi:hypothetical protein